MRMLSKNPFKNIAFFCLLTGLSSDVYSTARDEEDRALPRLNMPKRQEVTFKHIEELSLESFSDSGKPDEDCQERQDPFGVYLPSRPRGDFLPLDVLQIKRENIAVMSLTCPSTLSAQSVDDSFSSFSKSCPETSHMPVISSPEQDTRKSRRRSSSTKKSRKEKSVPPISDRESVQLQAISLSEEPKSRKSSVSVRRLRTSCALLSPGGGIVPPRFKENLLLKLARSAHNSATSGMRAVSIQDTGLFFSASRLARSEGESSPRCAARAELLPTPFRWVESLTLSNLMCEQSLTFYLEAFPNLAEVIVVSCRNVEYAHATSGFSLSASSSASPLSPRTCILKGLAQIAGYVNTQTGDVRLKTFALPCKAQVSTEDVNEVLVKAGLTAFEYVGVHAHTFDGASRSLHMFQKS